MLLLNKWQVWLDRLRSQGHFGLPQVTWYEEAERVIREDLQRTINDFEYFQKTYVTIKKDNNKQTVKMKNSDYHMIIRNTDNDLKDAFLRKVEALDLTISNDGETKTGIEHIKEGDSISVGTSDKFHINWARNYDYYANREIVPVYDIQFDWKKIVDRLNAYAQEVAKSKVHTLGDGDTVTYEDGFATIGESIDLDGKALKALKHLCNDNSGVNVSIDSDANTITFDNDVTITFDELDEISDKLEEANV